ncbi:MAG TPA: hypothetical protein VE967_03685 [Gemmatimonadaceae bacterium]|nr:hypothetical protein [Gemmatimonadaceae bacterium]
MKARRGIAMLAALWLITAITIVALEFAVSAHERRTLGLAAADRGREQATALGGLATMQARMEYDLRNGSTTLNATRGSDPWFGVDSTYSGTMYVDSLPVDVIAKDLGAVVNINTAQENDLRILFGYIIGNLTTADQLAAEIMDWRDVDDNARNDGAERDQYIKAGFLVLPANGPFREVDDLIHLYSMTPEVLELIRPYVTTHGTTQYKTNLNSAPEAVLRSLPGMTDQILAQILALRSSGRRITSVNQVLTASNRGQNFQVTGGRGGQPPTPQQARLQATQAQLEQRVIVTTTDVELTFLVYNPARTQPTRLVAILNRANNQANISWQLW